MEFKLFDATSSTRANTFLYSASQLAYFLVEKQEVASLGETK